MKIFKKIVSFLLVFVMVVAMIPINANAAEAKYSQLLLNIDWNKIKTVGKQASGSSSCSCYALAYATTMLANKVHYYSEYNQYGADEYNVLCDWSIGKFTSTWPTSTSEAYKNIYNELCGGNPVVVKVNSKSSSGSQHYVTIVGFENVTSLDKLSASNFLMLDPGVSGHNVFNLGGSGYDLKKSSNSTTWQVVVDTTSATVEFSATFNNYAARCTKYPSYGKIEISKDSTDVMSQPCNNNTDSESVSLEKASKGDTYISLGLYHNDQGNFWYQVKTKKTGADGYIYAGRATFVEQYKNDSQITDMVVPTTLTQGKSFPLEGSIKATYNGIYSIGAYVYPGTATSGDYETGTNVVLNSPSHLYSIKGSAVDDGVVFGSLAVGNYTFCLKVNLISYYATSATEKDYYMEGIGYTSQFAVSASGTGSGSGTTPSTYTITLRPSGADEANTSFNVVKGNAIGTLPTPSWSGMYFDGWYTSPFGGTKVTASTVPAGDMKLYGHWMYATGSEVKLEYDTNGGTLPAPALTQKIDRINDGRPEKELVVFNRRGAKITTNTAGVEVAVDSSGKIVGTRELDSTNELTVPDGGFVLSGHAHWDQSTGTHLGGANFVWSILALRDAGKDVYVHLNYETGMVKVFDSYTGYLAETKMGQAYTTYGVLPVPTRSGYVFTGWEAEGIDANYYSSFAGKYLTASWTSESQLSPEATTEYDGRRYELYDDIVSWTKAKALCESMGGHLVTITDSGEQAAVKALITQGTRGSYKIGATDEAAEGNWKWVTGEEFSYENWDPDYPEPSGGTGENYAGIIAIENPPYKNVGEWIDSPNAYYGGFYDLSNTGFICEYDGPPKYELTYHYGISENKSDTYEVDAGDVMVTSVPYAFGYNCLGWSTNPTAMTVDYLPYENITITGDTALYAVWEAAPVIPAVADQRVTIDGNFIDPAAQGFWHKFTPSVSGKYLFSKGTGSGDSFLYVYDENEELLAQSFKNYYTVLDIEAGKTVFVWTTCENASETTDFWVRVTREVNVSFDANGGSGAPDEYASVIGEAYFVSDAEPNKSGYTFLGWSTDKNATTAQYHAGDEITMTGDVTLYAVWECEHSYDYRLTKKPDLTTEGSMVGTCSTCYATTEAITLPKLNTTDYTYQEIKAATCTEAGSGKYTWKTTTYGSFGFDVVLEKLGHTYTDVVTAPNCTEKGYTTHTCACGDSYVDTYVDATGHKWDSSKVTTAATCTKDGVKTYTCTACKETKTEVIPATDHSYTAVVTAPNCTEKGYTTHTCSCGKSYVDSYVDATGHNHEAKRTEPTCSEPGYITYICACGDSYMGESIPSPGHNYQNGTCTRCGGKDPNYSETISGTCGENLTWTLDGKGVLTISGTGDMTEFDSSTQPWAEYMDRIYNVVVTDGVTSISRDALRNCVTLESVDVADTVTTIGSCAFMNCTSLESADTGDGITTLKSHVFKGCSALTDVTISNKVTWIDQSAFEGCSTLSTITFPDTLTKINAFAFKDCKNLKEIELPAAVNDLAYAVFAGCYNLKEINVAEGNETYCSVNGVVYSTSKATLYAVPAGWTGKFTVPERVKWIAEQAFRDCIYITEVELPEVLIWIQSRAFMNCTGITKITIPKNVTLLKTGAFYSCSNLKEIKFMGKAPTFESDVFKNVTATVYYPTYSNTWTSDVMKDYGGSVTWTAYDTCATGHSYADTVKKATCTQQGYTTHKCTVCGDAFKDSYVDALGHSWNSGEVTTEATCTVDGVKKLTCTVCSDTTTEVIPATGHTYDIVVTEANCTEKGYTTHTCACGDSYVDSYVDALGHNYQEGTCTRCDHEDPGYSGTVSGKCGKNLTWTLDVEGVLIISGTGEMDYTWPWKEHINKLQHVVVSDGVTSISPTAFFECVNLKTVEIADSVLKIGYNAFYGCTSLEKVDTGNGITTLANGTFSGCTALREIDLSKNLTTIDGSAIRKCTSLENIILPETLVEIGNAAFCDCTNLNSIVFPESVATIDNGAFSGCINLTEVEFLGSAPTMGSDVFKNVTATVRYPSNNETWTETAMQDYGGTLTWVAVGAEDDEEITITINSTVGSVSAPEGGWKEGTNTFTVAAEKPCVVAVSYDGGSTYVRLAASATGTANTYSFTADDITADSVIAVAMTGDTNKDGKLTNADITRMKAAYQSKVQLDGLTQLAADVNNSGGITNADVTKLKAVYQNKTTFAW